MFQVVGGLVCAALLLNLSLAVNADSCAAKRPNIIFIFTDDQDLHLGSLDYMSSVERELAAKGTSFSNHFATVSQCCPSRASLFRGQHAHNTNITFVTAPGYANHARLPKFDKVGVKGTMLIAEAVETTQSGSHPVKIMITYQCGSRGLDTVLSVSFSECIVECVTLMGWRQISASF